jgi:uncharacterized membrane protein
MTSTTDRTVESYLAAVRRAVADLPLDRQDDLLADLREHITAARADLDPETEAGVRAILDRLGDPAAIAAEARLGSAPPRPAPVPAPPRGGGGTKIALIIVGGFLAVVLLVCGVLVALGLAVAPMRVETHPVPAPSVSHN